MTKLRIENWEQIRRIVLAQVYMTGQTSPEQVLELTRNALGTMALWTIKSDKPQVQKQAARVLCQLLTEEPAKEPQVDK